MEEKKKEQTTAQKVVSLVIFGVVIYILVLTFG